MNPFYKKLIGFILILSVAQFSACEDDDSGESFPLPAATTATVPDEDPGAFDKAGIGKAPSAAAGLAWAAVSLSRAGLELTAALIRLPLAAIATQQINPDKDGDTYTWEASWNYLTAQYGLRLEAVGDRTSADWKLYATNSVLGLDDYLWMEAETENYRDIDVAGTHWESGTWILHDPNVDADSDAVLEIDWQFQDGIEPPNVTVTNTNSTVAGFSDTLSFTVNGDTSTWVLHDESAAADSDIIINWDRNTFAGDATDGNGTTYCWDASFEAITCP